MVKAATHTPRGRGGVHGPALGGSLLVLVPMFLVGCGEPSRPEISGAQFSVFFAQVGQQEEGTISFHFADDDGDIETVFLDLRPMPNPGGPALDEVEIDFPTKGATSGNASLSYNVLVRGSSTVCRA